MKVTGSLIFLLLLLCQAGTAQQKKSVSENKYRINLPSYWKAGNKAWQTLADHLPEVCPELTDKELCGDNCRPKYSVEFYMSEPVLSDYRANMISTGMSWKSYNFVTSFSFECALLLFDDKDKLITKITVVDPSEVWTVTHRAELRTHSPALPLHSVLVGFPSMQGNAGGMRYAGTAIQEQTPYAYIKDNADKLYPTRTDMLNVVDEKFRDL